MEGFAAAFATLIALTPLIKDEAVQTPKWIVEVYGGRSLTPFLGSEDMREAYGVSIQHTRPERRLRFREVRGELGLGLTFGGSWSDGVDLDRPNRQSEYGFLSYARWYFGKTNSVRLYTDLGWGLHYSSRRTHDLESRLNSTPYLAFGVLIPNKTVDWLVGARVMHISNGGTVGHNRGQNQLLVTLGVRF